MFAIFGLGPTEIIVLMLVGVFVIGAPTVAIILMLTLSRRSRGGDGDELVALRAENQRLRDEMERLKKAPDRP